MSGEAARLEELRAEIRAESISWGELADLQDLAAFIEPGDVELLEWAGVPEFPEDGCTDCQTGHPVSHTHADHVPTWANGFGTWHARTPDREAAHAAILAELSIRERNLDLARFDVEPTDEPNTWRETWVTP